jgi:hypothetical protein
MPSVNPIKGMHSLKTSGAVNKSAIPDKQDSDFIKLYMLEKERTRLRNEQSKILLRLEIIQNRLNDIQEFYDEKTGLPQNPKQERSKSKNSDEGDTEFKTISIDY